MDNKAKPQESWYSRIERLAGKSTEQKAEDCVWLLTTIKQRCRKGRQYVATDSHIRSGAYLERWTKHRYFSAKKVLIDHGLLRTRKVITDRGVAQQWIVAEAMGRQATDHQSSGIPRLVQVRCHRHPHLEANG